MKRLYTLAVSLLLLLISIPVSGASVTLPYTNSCTDLSTVAGTTSNGGTKDWNVYQNAFRVSAVNSSTQSDASVFFPLVDFKVGKLYKISARVKTQYNRTPAGVVRIFLATFSSPNFKYDGDAIGSADNLNSTYDTKVFTYVPTENKTRYVAVNNNSPGNCGIFYLYEFSIEELTLNAPLGVTDLSVVASSTGTKQATISFTAPSTFISGETITGSFGVKIYSNGALINTLENLTPGQKVSYVQNFPQVGTYTLQAVSFNSEGEGEQSSANVTIGGGYAGPDIASDYTNGIRHKVLAVYKDGNESDGSTKNNGTVKISWEPIEGDSITYNVTRYPDGKAIATNTAETSAVDSGFDNVTPYFYYYQVDYVKNGEAASIGNSNGMSINNTVTYDVSFNAASTIYDFTLYDSDKDNSCWAYNNSNKAVQTRDRNDWLITPGLLLQKDKYYRVTSYSRVRYNPSGAEIKLGKSNTPDDMTQEIIPFYWERSTTNNGHDNFFSVEADGNYFVGVHALNPDNADTYNDFMLAELSVEEVSGNLPRAVEDLKVSFGKDSATSAKLSFIASPKGISGEALTELTKIEVYKDGELFNTLVSPTPGQEYSYDITLVSGVQNIYRVVPFSSAGEGVADEISATIITPPYTQTFNASDALDGFTVVDGSNDGYTWKLYANAARCYPGDTMDEWLITPPVHLEAGQYYKTYFTTYLEKESNYTSEITLYLGNAPTKEAMTTKVIDTYEVTGGTVSNAVLLKDYFTVAETGEYYLGFYATSSTSRSLVPVYVDNFNISASISPNVPGPATDLVITPDKNGGMDGVVSFTAPAVTISGTTLTSITSAVVYYDGEAIAEVSATPGENVSVNMTAKASGAHLFTVICNNSYGVGREAEDAAFFGINVPSIPVNVKGIETDKIGEVTVTWDAPETDVDGFPINPDLITYQVFVYDSDEGEINIAKDLTGYSYTFRALEEGSPQSFMRFGVRAYTSAGGSSGSLSRYVAVGPAYELPITESFGDYTPFMIFRQESVDGNGFASWGYNSVDPLGVEPVDNDNGMALMEAVFKGGSSGLITGKIKLNVEHPVLSFYVYNYSGTLDTNILNVQVTPADYQNWNWKMLEQKCIYEWATNEPGWQKVIVDLSDYAGQTVHVAFVAEAVMYRLTHIDCLKFKNIDEQDLTLMNLYTPEETYPGLDFEINAVIKNNGNAEVSGDYTVTLYRNDDVIATVEGTALPKGEKKTFTFTDNVSIFEAEKQNGEFYYRALISYNNDGDFDDNYTDQQLVYINTTPYPEVVALSAKLSEDGNDATLTWEAPTLPTEATTVTDDVESYTSWSTMNDKIGDWTMVDEDDSAVAGINGISMPNIELASKQAFFVMDFTTQAFVDFNATQDVIRFAAHSGDKCFGAISLYSQPAQSLNWLISPLLTGHEQTISFYAKSIISTYPESFKVMYSTTDKNIDSFVELAYESNVPDSYTLYTYTLPEGAKYFAIYHYTVRGFIFMVDDITYTPAGNERLTITGYNVYRDGEAKAKSITQNSFTEENLPSGIHSYDVSVLYNLGESMPQSTQVTVSNVDALFNDEPNAYGLNGNITVVNVDGMRVNVYSADGSHVATAKGMDVTTIQCNPGVYVVKAGDNIWKVVVR